MQQFGIQISKPSPSLSPEDFIPMDSKNTSIDEEYLDRYFKINHAAKAELQKLS